MRALAAATEGRTDVFPRGIRLAPEALLSCPLQTACLFHKALTCPGCFSSILPQNRHPERSASQIDRVTQRLWRGVDEPVPRVAEGTSALLNLPMLLEAFRPPRPAIRPPLLDEFQFAPAACFFFPFSQSDGATQLC